MHSNVATKCALACFFVVALLALLLVSWVPELAAEEKFDHLTTGFRLEGAHRAADCESCHSNGIFTGTPTACGDCHAQASRIRASNRPPTHLQTTEQCDSCHRPFAWAPVLRFDHLETRGTCSSCHDNRIVAGQHPQHQPTTAECDTCHNTRFWR